MLFFNCIFKCFIYYCCFGLCCCTQVFSSCREIGDDSLVVVCGLLIVVASLVRQHGLQGTQASVAVAHGLSSCISLALEHRLGSWGTWVQLLHGTWNFPEPGIEPMSPTLPGSLPTMESPWKPHTLFKIYIFLIEKILALQYCMGFCHTTT